MYIADNFAIFIDFNYDKYVVMQIQSDFEW